LFNVGALPSLASLKYIRATEQPELAICYDVFIDT